MTIWSWGGKYNVDGAGARRGDRKTDSAHADSVLVFVPIGQGSDGMPHVSRYYVSTLYSVLSTRVDDTVLPTVGPFT